MDQLGLFSIGVGMRIPHFLNLMQQNKQAKRRHRLSKAENGGVHTYRVDFNRALT